MTNILDITYSNTSLKKELTIFLNIKNYNRSVNLKVSKKKLIHCLYTIKNYSKLNLSKYDRYSFSFFLLP